MTSLPGKRRRNHELFRFVAQASESINHPEYKLAPLAQMKSTTRGLRVIPQMVGGGGVHVVLDRVSPLCQVAPRRLDERIRRRRMRSQLEMSVMKRFYYRSALSIRSGRVVSRS
jgi:hypothetical protein